MFNEDVDHRCVSLTWFTLYLAVEVDMRRLAGLVMVVPLCGYGVLQLDFADWWSWVFLLSAVVGVGLVLVRRAGPNQTHPEIRGDEDSAGMEEWPSDVLQLEACEQNGESRFQRVRTDFVANASHELRTPIASVLGFAETLLQGSNKLDSEQKFLAEAILRNSKRLRDLLEDILHLARVEALEANLPTAPLHMLSVLQEAVAPSADLAARKSIEFVLVCPDKLEFSANKESIQTIVANLASNATKYTAEGGEVTVSCWVQDGGLNLVVKDNGLGIDPKVHDRVFERFYRVDVGRSRAQGGTGLGLALVKHLVLANNGTIKLESQLGQGSTFTIRFEG